MHYYQFNIGDYKSHTSHLTIIEDIAYRRLLDMYYLHEKPLDNSIPAVARLIGMREYEAEVEMVLLEFFVCDMDIGGWVNPRADKEIHTYQGFIDAGKRGAAKRWSKGSDSHHIAPPIANNNHKPLTKNQEPSISSPKGSRYSADSILSAQWGNIALEIRDDWNNEDVQVEFEAFRDYWIAKPGKDGIKLDWLATWRNWCRSSKRRGKHA